MGKRRIIQISTVVKDLQQSMENHWKILGIGPWDVYTLSSETVTGFTLYGRAVEGPFKFMLAVASRGDIQFELIQPVKGCSIYENFLKKCGEGLHHVKEKVDEEDLDQVLKEFKKKGIEVILSGKFDGDLFYYLDTEHTLGYVFEIGNCGKVRSPNRRYPPEQ